MDGVYLETSFVSACVTDRDDAASVYRRETSLEWWMHFSSRYDCTVSEEVIVELSQPGFRQSEAALEHISAIPRLDISDEVLGVAEVLVRERVMPGPVAGDALHIAVAAVHAMTYVLSWNVRHLANPNKVEHLQVICRRLGLVAPSIVTPEMLWSSP
ncbi:MAG: hypothetical protein KF757_04970 [Phycisphaeraceae bacterium]|nr:hypothetical protein [Phycisphaeraceae bacterium]MCW5763881.1 hypothetical protein [Phycisphaeraceae bacterium]